MLLYHLLIRSHGFRSLFLMVIHPSIERLTPTDILSPIVVSDFRSALTPSVVEIFRLLSSDRAKGSRLTSPVSFTSSDRLSIGLSLVDPNLILSKTSTSFERACFRSNNSFAASADTSNA